MVPAKISASFRRTKEARRDTVFEAPWRKEKSLHANKNNFYKVKPPPIALTFYQLCLRATGRPENTFKI